MNSRRKEFPVLETERLILRQLKTADTQELLDLYSDEGVTQFLGIDKMKTLEEAARLMQMLEQQYEQGTGLRWGAFEKEEGLLIGTCGYHDWDHQRSRAELGYDLARRHWGQGYMREALQVVLGYGFEPLKLHRIEAFVDPEDRRSQNLLSSLGFQLEGILHDHDFIKGKFQDDMVYALLQPAWIKKD
jgi:ribosomal-protein-alanine N-acetyltransferase